MEESVAGTPEGGGEQEQQHQPIGEPDYESLAREQGWRPKEEYEGDTKNWLDAVEFVKRGPFLKAIKRQERQIHKLEQTIEAMAKHYNENLKQAKERAISELKEQRKEAIELGEVAKVEDIDKKIDHVKAMKEPEVPPPSVPSEIQQFIEANQSWWEKDADMTEDAIYFNEKYLRKNPGKLAESLEATLAHIKKLYPEKFENPKRESKPPVEGASPATKTTPKYSVARLNKEQKMVYEQMVTRYKQMTHDEYFKSLEDIGALE